VPSYIWSRINSFFTQEVERTLKSAATIQGKQTKDVENAGTVQRATVYSIQINGIKARVVLQKRKLIC
jgi:hypothetical protein